MIQVLALDIDGVLTDGKVTLDQAGRESKTLCYRDIDAVFAAHRQGLKVVLVTGEDSPIVGVIARRLSVFRVYRNAKDKGATLTQVSQDLGLSPHEISYIGDSTRDAPALALVGLGLAPADATEAARAAAHRVLCHRGGEGAVSEALTLILEMRRQAIREVG